MKLTLIPKTIIFSLLCLLTLIAHFTIERYYQVGNQLLQNNTFEEGLQGWVATATKAEMVSVDKNQVRLYSTAAGEPIYLSQSIKNSLPGGRVAFKARARTENLAAGPKGRLKCRILLLQYQQGKPQYRVSHVLTSLEGTSDWTDYRAIFVIMPGTTEVRVILQLNNCTGKLYCRDLSLFKVEQNQVLRIVQWSIMVGWLCFAIALFVPLLDRAYRGWWKPVFTILVLMGIIVGTTLPGTLKHDLTADIIHETKTYSKALSGTNVVAYAKDTARKFSIDNSFLDITKYAHFGLFGLLTFLLLWQNVHSNPLLTLLDILMLACATELLQLFVEGRSALPFDVVIDMAGSVTGLFVWKRWLWYKK